MVLTDALEDLDLARGRRTLMAFNDDNGIPLAINPDDVMVVRISVLDPNGIDAAQSLEPGWIDGDPLG